jgi:citronellol/citronellal dehydrogenase
MCVLGMHEELRDYGIAVNALWPRTMIWTAAVSNMVYENNRETMDGCRKPDIMADSAYLILKKSKNFTGNFLVDDTFLASEGLKPKDFLEYSYDPCKITHFFAFLIY